MPEKLNLFFNKKTSIVVTVIASVVFLSSFAIFISCNENHYKAIPPSYLKLIQFKKKNIYPKNSYYAVAAFPKGYVKDASKDYTAVLQKVLLEHPVVVLPNFPIMVNGKGLSLPSNSILYFQSKTKLILAPNDYAEYQVLRIHDVKNVSVYNAVIVGDKYSHLGSKGEWGMGISIRGTQNIKIYNAKVSKCWGDGIYLGVTDKDNKNINITLDNIISDDNRRNAMSVISAQNLYVNRMLVSNTSGTSPMAGIDLEPDSLTDEMKNLNFNNIISFNNKAHGFLIVLHNLTSAKNTNSVTAKIKNLKIDDCDYGLSLKFQPDQFQNEPGKGNITVENVDFKHVRKMKILSYDGNIHNQIDVVISPNYSQNDAIPVFEQEVKNARNIRIQNAKKK